MTSVRIISRPYTNPTIKNPTYPTVLEDHRIVEMTWEEREGKVMLKHKPEEYINIKE